ncbi:hypothetical protein X733_33175 [Mesorhizobium sp. L2C067A000]|nr:hypothetical protein X733_33175 [Mesorhizobium sp. L2C067A000]
MRPTIPFRKQDELAIVYRREYLGSSVAEGPPRLFTAINQNSVRSPRLRVHAVNGQGPEVARLHSDEQIAAVFRPDYLTIHWRAVDQDQWGKLQVTHCVRPAIYHDEAGRRHITVSRKGVTMRI